MIIIEEREFEKTLEFKSFNQQQVININGQIKTLNIENLTLICPHCGTTLMQFQQGVRKADILKSLFQQEWSLNYCIKCGQKLKRPECVDIETFESKEKIQEEVGEVNKDE